MAILQWCRMQIMCLLILAYIGIIYIREGNILNRISAKTNCNYIYDALFITAELAVIFDGVTACTVNFLTAVPRGVNLLIHLGMYLSYEIYVALLFWYWVSVTVGVPKRKLWRVLYTLPSLVFACLTVCLLPQIEFVQGEYTNYSMGTAVYVCFTCVAIYCAMTVAIIVAKYRYIPKHKRQSLAMTLVCVAIILSLQIIFPEFLISSIAIAMITISIYINMENPAIKELEHYHNEMVMGFATLVDSKDDSTGGHIRRSSAYALLIGENLRKNKAYKNEITKDFLNNLTKSAPMHDIGKIGIPDAILQKPGKLTPEEYEKMKEHPVIGGEIIEETFSHLGNGEYESMAYEIARYHHEKWNGGGYPEGLSGTEIPLCARIMAVADVFDAVSAKRCYRDAMPLQACYAIIRNGRGMDFDPDVVDAFLADMDEVEAIYYSEHKNG